ncbi:MAG: FG-GAP-like repeat-containing protein [Pirellulales bacterium]
MATTVELFRRCRIRAVLLLLVMSSIADAEEVGFHRHVIDRSSAYSACAAIDINRDGKLDIANGGFWFESPTWKKHKLRNVQMIRGRYDDYSNLPLDVDRDGWSDLVSVNYRSKSLYWVKHPGSLLGVWTKHVIDTPGPSETGRLVDVDGDGQLDVLPNGTTFAAWYERKYDTNGGVGWIRHDLPKEIVGHGIGFGDIDADGQGDLVGTRGWLKAPENPRTERWLWQAEFSLHRDGSIPILVHDVDADGDADLIWGRGHNVGLYWLEQTRDSPGGRGWIKHAIDTTWSQSHTVMLADIDGDGQEDVVAGKRYLGHDGKDPGEYDPLVVYWYKFDTQQRIWRRNLVSWGNHCGFDLDSKCVDMDGDGDVDILAATRGGGLSLLENLRVHNGEPLAATNNLPLAPQYDDHADLLNYIDASGGRHDVEQPFDWTVRRSHILANMQRVMGSLPGPERRVPLDMKVVEKTVAEKYIRLRITYAAEQGDRVPAFLLMPTGLKAPAPALLCLHPTSSLGKSQICGLGGKPSRFYAHELAERGYVCLAPDYMSFGEYHDYDFAADDYVSGTMKGIWNHIRGIDLLESLPEVKADRIGCIGHSLGGHNALFVASFDQRLRVVVTSCGFNAFEDYYGGDLKGWSSERYMPRIREQFDSDPRKMPFDFHEIVAAIAPRPLFINAPLRDSNFAVAGVRKAVDSARNVYKLRGAETNLHAVYPEAAHDFPLEIRNDVYRWLDQHLRK